MIRFHHDVGLFREAVSITQLRTGFAERLIEKDYFCSLLLEYLAAVEKALVFKGGTRLVKVYADFYRLSEDLDFVIPMATGASRAGRSKQAAGLKKAVTALPQELSVFLPDPTIARSCPLLNRCPVRTESTIRPQSLPQNTGGACAVAVRA